MAIKSNVNSAMLNPELESIKDVSVVNFWFNVYILLYWYLLPLASWSDSKYDLYPDSKKLLYNNKSKLAYFVKLFCIFYGVIKNTIQFFYYPIAFY